MKTLKIQANNENLLSYLREHGSTITTPCGGKGICGKCRVRVLEGEKTLSMPYPNLKSISLDEWEQGFRLACKITVNEDLVIEQSENKAASANIMADGDYTVALEPLVKKVYLELPKPSIEDQASAVDRLEKVAHPAKIHDLNLIRRLPLVLEDHNYCVTAVMINEIIIGVEGGDTTGHNYGVAIDIGTTTMAGVLVDLNTGDEIGVYSCLNPQKLHGDDVISRIDYTIENPDGLDALQKLVNDKLNEMFRYFSTQYHISSDNIYHVSIVGNTVMMHLLAGFSVKSIAASPFTPALTHYPVIRGKDLELHMNPMGIITSLPMVAGYIGADTLGCILASDMADSADISLMIDIGTNGEIALGNKDRIVSCAAAAGPALEGGHIQCGSGGVDGAVSTIKIEDTGVYYKTISDNAPNGICGSGVVDAVAEMLNKGLVESYGRMISCDEANEILTENIAARLGEYGGKPRFMLVSKEEGAEQDIFITQKDIREIQLAKAAISAGIKILMKELNVEFNDIKRVYLAGGFGNYINKDNAMRIGLIPPELKGKIVSIGNGALTGAKITAKSNKYMEKAEKIMDITKYVELSTRLDFQTIFVDNMEF